MNRFTLVIVAVLIVIAGIIWWRFLLPPKPEGRWDRSDDATERVEARPAGTRKHLPGPVPFEEKNIFSASDASQVVLDEENVEDNIKKNVKKNVKKNIKGTVKKNVTVIPEIIIIRARAMKDPDQASRLLSKTAHAIEHSNPKGAVKLCDEVVDLVDPGNAYRKKAEDLKARILKRTHPAN